MIKSKFDYTNYLNADRIALNKPKLTLIVKIQEILSRDFLWKFERLLRKCEYLKNVKAPRSFVYKIIYFYYKIKFKNLSLKLGFSIPENVFGPGLAILHYGTIIVNPRTKIGSNCRIHANVNIGESGGVAGAPKIGDNVYIGPGAKIFGNITIPNNCAIGANAAVNKSINEEGMMVAGVPAKVVKKINIKQIIKHID
jgi:serine O-acetyltransferase